MRELNCIFWNVGRLIEPRESEIALALETTPATGWTAAAAKSKIRNLGAVLRHASQGTPPALLGLCEVQNSKMSKAVVSAAGWQNDLIEATAPPSSVTDHDVTLYFSPAVFQQVGAARVHNVHQRFATRDVYEVKLSVVGSSQEFTVLVHHWPSRTVHGSESLRIALADHSARIVREHLKFGFIELRDSIGRARVPSQEELMRRWDHPVLLMGDFNDEPWDPSIRRFLASESSPGRVLADPRLRSGAGRAAVKRYLERRPRLFNATWELLGGDRPVGSAYWQGSPFLLDQLLLSRGFLLDSLGYVSGSLRLVDDQTVPFGNGTLRVASRTGKPLQFRVSDQQGASDHFALAWKLRVP